jgi:hypothetical protein
MNWLRGTPRWYLAAAALGTAAAVLAFAVFAGFRDDDGDAAPRGKPREVTAGELRSFALAAPHPIYWAGRIPGFKFELTHTRRDHVFVRYLPEDVLIGSPRTIYTTIGSYPTRNAYAVARAAAAKPDATRRVAPGGGLAVWRRALPRTVYLAYPGSDVLVEVYAANASRARKLALSGQVGPIR